MDSLDALGTVATYDVSSPATTTDTLSTRHRDWHGAVFQASLSLTALLVLGALAIGVWHVVKKKPNSVVTKSLLDSSIRVTALDNERRLALYGEVDLNNNNDDKEITFSRPSVVVQLPLDRLDGRTEGQQDVSLLSDGDTEQTTCGSPCSSKTESHYAVIDELTRPEQLHGTPADDVDEDMGLNSRSFGRDNWELRSPGTDSAKYWGWRLREGSRAAYS